MEGRLDCHIDRKRSQSENVVLLYEALFSRNITNHKVISKYRHSCEKLIEKIVQLKKTKSQRRNMSHSKIAKRAVQETQTVEGNKRNESKNRLVRPKTSKLQKKVIHLKGSNSKN